MPSSSPAEKHHRAFERRAQKWRAHSRGSARHCFCARGGHQPQRRHRALPAHVESLNHSAPIETAIEEFLTIREAEGKSRVHLADLRQRLNRFARAFGSRLAASISTKELDGWLHGLVVGPQTRTNFRRVIHNFFAFCAARGYCAGNPVTQASKPRCRPRTIGILTVEQTRALLKACPESILPAVAIGMFAGLRASEITATRLEFD